MTFYVYALIDPVNNIPFYIGKGKGNNVVFGCKKDACLHYGVSRNTFERHYKYKTLSKL